MITGGSRPNRALTASETWVGAAGAGGGVGVFTTGGGAGETGALGSNGVGGPTLAGGGLAAGGTLGMSAGGRGGANGSLADWACASCGAVANPATQLAARTALASRRNPWPRPAAHVPMHAVKRSKLGDFKPRVLPCHGLSATCGPC